MTASLISPLTFIYVSCQSFDVKSNQKQKTSFVIIYFFARVILQQSINSRLLSQTVSTQLKKQVNCQALSNQMAPRPKLLSLKSLQTFNLLFPYHLLMSQIHFLMILIFLVTKLSPTRQGVSSQGADCEEKVRNRPIGQKINSVHF